MVVRVFPQPVQPGMCRPKGRRYVQTWGFIYFTTFISILLILLSIVIVFLWSTPKKLFFEGMPEKAPSSFVKSLRSGIGIEGVSVNHIPIIVEPFSATGYHAFLPIRRNVRFGIDSFFYREAICIHDEIEAWGFGGSRIVWGYFKRILTFGETRPSRYRYNLGGCPSLVEASKAEKSGLIFVGSYADDKPWTFGIDGGLSSQPGSIGGNLRGARLFHRINSEGYCCDGHDEVDEVPIGQILIVVTLLVFGGWGLQWLALYFHNNHGPWRIVYYLGIIIMISGFGYLLMWQWRISQRIGKDDSQQYQLFHSRDSVAQKYLWKTKNNT